MSGEKRSLQTAPWQSSQNLGCDEAGDEKSGRGRVQQGAPKRSHTGDVSYLLTQPGLLKCKTVVERQGRTYSLVQDKPGPRLCVESRRAKGQLQALGEVAVGQKALLTKLVLGPLQLGVQDVGER